MSRRSRALASWFVLAVAIAVGIATSVLLEERSVDASNSISVEKMEAAATRAKGAPVSLQFDPPDKGQSRADMVSARDKATGDVFWFRGDGSEIIYHRNKEGWNGGAGPRKSRAELETLASESARRICPALFSGKVTRSLDEADVEDGNVVAVEYRAYSSEGVRIGFARVELNAVTGALRTYNSDGPVSVTVSLDSKVREGEAVSMAAETLGMPIHVLEEAELAIFRPIDAEQRLVWNVRLRTGDEEVGALGFVTIDAHTGEVVESAVAE